MWQMGGSKVGRHDGKSFVGRGDIESMRRALSTELGENSLP